jgi:hypothetical protein
VQVNVLYKAQVNVFSQTPKLTSCFHSGTTTCLSQACPFNSLRIDNNIKEISICAKRRLHQKYISLSSMSHAEIAMILRAELIETMFKTLEED